MARKVTSRSVRTISEYLAAFEETVKAWADPKRGTIQPWCRGVKSASFSLVPTEYHGPKINADEMRAAFQLRALPMLRQNPTSEWEWYFLMRHHGLPTRLLDWTTGSLLALYFAVRDDPGSSDAAVWVLDPWALNRHTVRRSDLLMAADSLAAPYLPKVYAKRKLPKGPAAIVPSHNSARITVQRGTFTIHGSCREGIEKLFSDRLLKIVIPKIEAVPIKRALRLAGIGEFTVFPELDGLCREICDMHRDGG
jgi:FRG domain